MRTDLSLLLAGLLAVLGSSCTAPQPQAEPQPDYRLTATIKDIMDSMVDPAADYVWESVKTTITEKAVEEKRPRTDKDWAEVRRHAIMLLEATNLLVMPGRKVAPSGQKSENPNIELEPAQIEVRINQDRKSWIELSHALHDTIVPVLKAIDNKNAEELQDSGDAIDRACENCHLKYWYPNETGPRR